MASLDLLARAARIGIVALFGCLVVMACSPPEVTPFSGSPGATSGKKKKKAPDADSPRSDENEEEGSPREAPGPQAPTLTAVSPDSVPVGTSPGGIDVTLSGSRFVAGSMVDVGGTQVAAAVSSPNELKVRVPGAQLATAKVIPLTVITPNGESNALSFTVANPTSVSITTLAPQTAVAGTNNVALTVTGTGFISTSVVRFNGAAVTTTFRSATELAATVPGTALTDAGRVSVTVSNGTDVVSLPASFEITNPTPQIATLSPNRVTAGNGATAITVSGTGFTRSSEVVAGQTPLATTFVSATELRATLPASLVAAAGSVSVRVQTPAPGGGSSATQTITVEGGQQATCAYPCATYGYAPGECAEGWACNGATGCLYQTTCGGAGGGGGGGGGQCLYRCADYGYAPGQCYNGWYCLPDGAYAGCLGQTTC